MKLHLGRVHWARGAEVEWFERFEYGAGCLYSALFFQPYLFICLLLLLLLFLQCCFIFLFLYFFLFSVDV